jgi:trehalose synthase
MLQPIAVGHKTLADYSSIVGRQLVEEIRELAEPHKGKRVLHLSATAFGGGVSEILYTLIPLMKDVGIDVEWQVIYGREEFFNATKVMHNALQGNPQDLTEEQWEAWRRYNEMNARELSRGWDVCIVHDPQPAAMHTLAPEKSRHWVWRCHIDLSTPNPRTIERLLPSSRRRSTRSRRRTWPSRRRTRSTSASSSGSTSTGRCCARSRASTRGRTRSA